MRPDGAYGTGDAALVRLSTEEFRDPIDANVVLQHAIPSRVQALCNSLTASETASDTVMRSIEEQTTRALVAILPVPQAQPFNTEWSLRYEEARTRAGLELNQVACSYLWLKQGMLPGKHCDDLKLQLRGDLTRFDELRTLALRLSHRVEHQQARGDVFYGGHGNDDEEHYDEIFHYDEEAWWTDGGEWGYLNDPYEEVYYEDYDYQETPDKSNDENDEEAEEEDPEIHAMGHGQRKEQGRQGQLRPWVLHLWLKVALRQGLSDEGEFWKERWIQVQRQRVPAQRIWMATHGLWKRTRSLARRKMKRQGQGQVRIWLSRRLRWLPGQVGQPGSPCPRRTAFDRFLAQGRAYFLESALGKIHSVLQHVGQPEGSHLLRAV